MKPFTQILALSALAWLLALQPACAGLSLTLDEWGNLNHEHVGYLAPDPSGGVPDWDVLIYNLPFPGVQGDVLFYEPPTGLNLSDVVRFDGNYHLIFYSDNTDGYNTPADAPYPPTPFYPNQASFLESGSSLALQLLNYTPSADQPGWDPSNPSYTFISEVPEPGGATLLLMGLGCAWVAGRRRNV